MSRKILLQVGEPLKYGYGHLSRMGYLAQELASAGYQVNISFEENPQNDYHVYVLDRRDEPFGEAALQSGSPLLCIDNLGEGSRQADIAVHCLPATNMSDDEVVQALKHCILPPQLSHYSSQTFRASVKRVKQVQGQRGYLWLPPKKRRYCSHEIMSIRRREMLRYEQIITYFGQTLFEALYLGKKVLLYDISVYHANLSRWFCAEVFAKPLFAYHFDGQGLRRLAEKVKRLARA